MFSRTTSVKPAATQVTVLQARIQVPHRLRDVQPGSARESWRKPLLRSRHMMTPTTTNSHQMKLTHDQYFAKSVNYKRNIQTMKIVWILLRSVIWKGKRSEKSQRCAVLSSLCERKIRSRIQKDSESKTIHRCIKSKFISYLHPSINY